MKIPSPCIDVCKYKYKNHCIGCSMTKIQKRLLKDYLPSTKKRLPQFYNQSANTFR